MPAARLLLRLQHRINVFIYGEATKNGSLLRQIAQAFTRSLVHGKLRDIFIANGHGSLIRMKEPYHHIKAGCFTCAIGAE